MLNFFRIVVLVFAGPFIKSIVIVFRGGSRNAATSKMERFVMILNGFQIERFVIIVNGFQP